MTFAMSADRRRLLPVAAALALALAPLQARAADDYGAGGFEPSTTGVLGEAAKAVVDRVFGVKGEAADIKYHAVELSNHSPVNAGIRSAIVPGWGQWFNRQPVKASALFVVVAAGVVGTVKTHNRANDAYDAYKAEGLRNGSKYDDYVSARTNMLVLGGATIFLWAYGIFDAYHNAYNPLWSQEPSVQLAALPDGAAVTYRRRF